MTTTIRFPKLPAGQAPAKVVNLYGPSGVGKSTWARSLPNSVRIDLCLAANAEELWQEISLELADNPSVVVIVLDEADKFRSWQGQSIPEVLQSFSGLFVLLSHGPLPEVRNVSWDRRTSVGWIEELAVKPRRGLGLP